MNDISIDILWLYACSGNTEKLKLYYNEHGKINKRYNKFNTEHSLIIGAFRNNQFETVEYLISVGETLTEKEKEEMLIELKRIDIMKRLIRKENEYE